MTAEYSELFKDSPATPREEQLLDRLSELHLNYAYALDFRNEVARALRESAGRGLSTPRELHAITDCAHVERDALDLHKALAVAIERLTYARNGLKAHNPHSALLSELGTNDLLRVLERTSRPVG